MSEAFESINQGFNSTYKVGELTLGVVVPIESYKVGDRPTMDDHIKRVQLAEKLGFSAVWLRDIPFDVPSFCDVGQMYDPFVYLGVLSAMTSKVALGVGSIILPLRHPLHIAKAATSVDQLSNGRLILGIASGDRPEEYPAMNLEYTNRGDRFREAYEYIKAMFEQSPTFDNLYGSFYGSLDMLPKPVNKKVPMLITGASQQSPEWLAQNGDGLITYPRNPELQGKLIQQFKEGAKRYEQPNKPVSQSLYIDLIDSDFGPQPIHLGYRLNTKHLLQHLRFLRVVGVNHVALNLRFNDANIEETLERISKEVLPFINE